MLSNGGEGDMMMMMIIIIMCSVLALL